MKICKIKTNKIYILDHQIIVKDKFDLKNYIIQKIEKQNKIVRES